jgi:hypothetical protein
MVIHNNSYKDVLDETLRRGLQHYHYFFHKYLTDDTYTGITFDEATRTIALIDDREKERTSTEDVINKWKQPLHYKRSKQHQQ